VQALVRSLRRLEVAGAADDQPVLHPDELVGCAFEQRRLVGDDEDGLA
jgi:hypothetical protein